MQKAWCNFKAG